jgi:hypothetical protein
MATFLNKKEQVIDLKLTSYGHYLFSIGSFKPEYYAFFDDNIIYDGAYMGISESQNSIIGRIKDETPYIESLVLFADAEKEVTKAPSELVNFFEVDITPTRKLPRKDIFKFDRAIGDAFLDGKTPDIAPAWKVVLLSGKINSVTERDAANNSSIPQINISADYGTRLLSSNLDFNPGSVGGIVDQTPSFADGKSIATQAQNLLFYVEEMNTEILTENFEIEIFHMVTGSTTGSLEKKFFQSKKPQIVDGMMVADRPYSADIDSVSISDAEYYFNLSIDAEVDREEACKAALSFNRKSYYVDLDFECNKEDTEFMYYDIYGSAVVPEICLD